MKRRSAHLLLLLVFTLSSLPFTTARAQSSVGFGQPVVENHFPKNLTFRIHVQSSDRKIVSARFYLSTLNDTSATILVLDIEPGFSLDLRYVWDTQRITIAPSTPMVYSWEVTLEDGSKVKSEEATYAYDDINYEWQKLENKQVAVWWHDRPAILGQQVFDIAQMAVKSQAELFEAELDTQIRIIIYNNFEEFAAWHSFIGDFVGGQAFPELGITTQIVPDEVEQSWWLYEVIPHEISHLYFYQVTRHPIVSPPAWLNEGIAQYNEFAQHKGELSYVEDMAWDGKLIRLQGLSAGFGNVNEEQIRLAYAESVSAVTYLVDTYGTEGLSKLMAAYKAGKNDKEAFPSALGVTPNSFEQDWLSWIGVPAEMYPVQSPYPTTKPLQLVDPISKTPTPPPAAAAQAASTSTLPPAATVSPSTPTSIPYPPDRILPPFPRLGLSLGLLCACSGGLALLLVLGLVLVVILKRK